MIRSRLEVHLLLAAVILLLVLVPGSFWHKPMNDATYVGLDPNLLYAGDQQDFQDRAGIRISRDEAVLIGTSHSHPVVHLVTTPRSFTAQFDVRIAEGGSDGVPLRIGVWSPRTRSGHFVFFEPSPEYSLTSRTFVRDSLLSPFGDAAGKRVALGKYSERTRYRVIASVDKKAGSIVIRLLSSEASPTGSPTLNLSGGPSRQTYSDVISEAVHVKGGALYVAGVTLRAAPRGESYKIALAWFDETGQFLSFTGDWQPVDELDSWTRRELKARAPRAARSVRVLLGSGDRTETSFTDIYLHEAGRPSQNLLRNGSFLAGMDGWSTLGEAKTTPRIAQAQVHWSSIAGRDLLPELFPAHRLPLSLTISSSTQRGASLVEATNYVLTLPHEAWQVDKVDDPRARSLIVALGLLAAVTVATRSLGKASSFVGPARGKISRRFTDISTPVLTLALVALFVGYLIANTLLFQLGSHPFDMLSARIWAYVSMKYGPTELYYLPSTVSLARVWGGSPYHEAIFPYGPTMAYAFAAAGRVYRSVLGGLVQPRVDAFQLEFIIKSLSVIFGFAVATMVFVIQRTAGRSYRESILAGAFVLLNPALVFSTSIWGQTQTWSLFFGLVAVWGVQTGHLPLAWFSLLLTILTRPQMLVVVAILGVFALLKWPHRKNLHAFAWSVIIAYLVFLPFLAKLGPTFPIAHLKTLFLLQVVGGNEPELTTVSLEAYSVWPLITAAFNGAAGLARFSFGSTLPLGHGLTYELIGNAAAAIVVASVIGLMILRRRDARLPDLFPLLAIGVIGFLMTKTGVAGAHFVIAVPFIALCYGAIPRTAFIPAVGIWTLTSTISMYASLGFAIADVPSLAPLLHYRNNLLTRLVMILHSSDWFISLACLANLTVLGILAYQVTLRWLHDPSRKGGGRQ